MAAQPHGVRRKKSFNVTYCNDWVQEMVEDGVSDQQIEAAMFTQFVRAGDVFDLLTPLGKRPLAPLHH